MRKLEKNFANSLFVVFCLLLLLLCFLLGCNYFFGSYFPAYLSQVVQVFDLNDKLTASSYMGFELSVMNNSSTCTGSNDELIFLSCNPQDRPPILFVFDNNLNLKNATPVPTCTASPPCNYSFDDLHMVRNAGNFRVGNFTVEANGTVDEFPAFFTCHFGLGCEIDNYEMRTGSDMTSSSNLMYYDILGSFNTINSPFITIDENPSNFYQLLNVYRDIQQAADRQVGLFFYHESENYRNVASLFFLPDFPFTPVGSLMTDTSVKKITLTDFDTENTGIFYTRKGLVVQHNSMQSLYDFSGNELATAAYDRDDWLNTAYDLDGNYFYIFNSREKQLYKCHTWWNK